jgi:prolyl-tRNA editing enzyme YbaK/EbsC (Cys-tRNA(Pro) deacylase)
VSLDNGFRLPTVDHVTAVLRAAGWDGTVHVFPDGVRTAQAAADGLGCEVGAIANSLIFDAARSPVLILTSGADQSRIRRKRRFAGTGSAQSRPKPHRDLTAATNQRT